MRKEELAYWLCFAGMKKPAAARKNQIYVQCYKHDPRFGIIDLFEDPKVPEILGLNSTDIALLQAAHQELNNCAIKVNELQSLGYSLIPIHCDEYPRRLKKKLGFKSPVMLYAKGNKELLKGRCIAIVGSRDANDASMIFTQNIAQKAVSDGFAVVSGYARGVDRKALDAALECGGSSIIVLPQGIETFSCGFKKYCKFINSGRLLVISAFDSKARWNVGYAMARNAYIYGLSQKIYVAQSSRGGGTWSGALDGLKRGDEIWIYYPQPQENIGNLLLIEQGAKPADINGNPLGGVLGANLDLFELPEAQAL